MEFSPSFLLAHISVLSQGVLSTLIISAISIVGAFATGLMCAWIRYERIPVLSHLVYIYVEILRSTPILAQVYLIYFGLPSLGVRFDSDVAAGVSLILWGGAYNTENLRAGMIAVPAGLTEASSALGFSRFSSMWLVILPLAFRLSIPAVTNTSISIFKSSSLMIGIGFHELTYEATNIIYLTFRITEMLVTLAVIYLGLATLMSLVARRLSERLQIGGL